MSNDEAEAITEFYAQKWQKEDRDRTFNRLKHKHNRRGLFA